MWLEHILLTICDKFDFFFLNDKKRKIIMLCVMTYEAFKFVIFYVVSYTILIKVYYIVKVMHIALLNLEFVVKQKETD